MTNTSWPRTRSPLRDILAMLSLWILVGAFFWRVVLAGRVLAGGDIFTYFYPYWSEATRALRSGRLPLWNPYLFAGVPFLANSQAGLLYPPNWPLWVALPAHRSVHLSPVLHLGLAAAGAYLWMRVSHGYGRVGAWTTGLVFALGGYLTSQFEHVNQVQGLAWLPVALLLYDLSFIARKPVSNRSVAAFAGLSVVVGMILLAGHVQTGFITLVGIAIYALAPTARRAWRRRAPARVLRPLALLALAAGIGIALAAVQLLPTWQLSRLSIRADGLPFKERVSFSLSPFYLARALLPGFSAPVPPVHLEHVAYVGVSGLVLAAVGVGCRHHQRRGAATALTLIVLGLWLSLGRYSPVYHVLARYVPGFAHFRVPARWLALYALGLAVLAGRGAQALWNGRGAPGGQRRLWVVVAGLLLMTAWAVVGVRVGEGGRVSLPTVIAWIAATALAVGLVSLARRSPRWGLGGLLLLLVIELFGAGLALPHARATAPQALTSLRPAIAHLQVSPSGRFLSISDITFDPGDLGELNVVYGPQLSSAALYDLVVATKQKEVLAPNLPLAFGVQAVDGYDGGVLPLARYVRLQELISSPGRVSLDGRLRENLTVIPEGRWLNMLDVRYIVTDKLRDAWVDDVFYDLQFSATLSPGASASAAHVPQFDATALGVVSHLQGAAALPTGTPVGEVEVGFVDGETITFTLVAGEDTAEGVFQEGVRHGRAPIGARSGTGEAERYDYATRLRWEEPGAPASIRVRAALTEGELVVRGLSLIDERTGSFQSLVISDQSRYRLVHSGDVKIYENLDALTQAHIVGDSIWVAGDDAALAAMTPSAFDPSESVVLDSLSAPAQDAPIYDGEDDCDPASATNTILADYPELMQITATTCTPAYLVISRAWFPGWEAWVDGAPTPVLRANLLLSAVPLEEGRHTVIFVFRPEIVRLGAIASLVAAICLVLVSVLVLRCPKVRGML